MALALLRRRSLFVGALEGSATGTVARSLEPVRQGRLPGAWSQRGSGLLLSAVGAFGACRSNLVSCGAALRAERARAWNLFSEKWLAATLVARLGAGVGCALLLC